MRKVSVALIILLAASMAMAQDKDYFDTDEVFYLEFNIGKTEPDHSSDFFDFYERTTTFEKDDLDEAAFLLKAQYQLNNRLSIGGALQYYSTSVDTEDADFVDVNNDPILQTLDFETTWVGFNLTWTPFGAGEYYGTKAWAPKRLVPYLSLGAGIKNWSLQNIGEFVDENDPNGPTIFRADFNSDGGTFATRLGCGLRVNLHPNIDLNLAYEHEFAEDDLDGDFRRFGDLDLGSSSGFVGIIFRL